MLILGIVVIGDQRGRTLGFPTANLLLGPDAISPPDGVFAGYVRHPEQGLHRAAISIGRRPTFYEQEGLRLVEAHLLEYRGDLYGEQIAVEIATKIRDQVRFSSVDELVDQLTADVCACADVLTPTDSLLCGSTGALFAGAGPRRASEV